MAKIILGISGYIGSGKSEAGAFFEKKGACFIDADKIVDKIYEKDALGYSKIKHFFGDCFIKKSGLLDRKKLAKFVFSDVNKLKILNGMIHPLVIGEIKKEMALCKNNTVVIEALYINDRLFEGLIDKVLWIECDKKNIFSRAAQKGQYDSMTVANIYDIQRQMPIRPVKPDYVIDNNGSKSQFVIRLGIVMDQLIDVEKKVRI